MSHHWMKLVALAALLAVAASCKTLDEGSASGTTGLPAASIPAETGTANCAGWNTWKFFEAATLERVTECLRTGADPKARDQRGNTPLHWAAWANKNPAVVDTLVKVGADPNARDKDDETPLHGAAWANKNPAVAAALLKAGADPNARNKKGRTPLNLAVRYKNSPAVAALLKAAAEPVARTGKTGPLLRKTAANSAENVGKVPAKDPKAEASRASAAPGKEMEKTTTASCEGWNTYDFLKTATVESVTRCLKAGADPNARDKDDETPLHGAAWANKNPAVAAALLKAGADPNARNKKGRTPLNLAVRYKNSPAVAALLKAAAEPNARTGKTGPLLRKTAANSAVNVGKVPAKDPKAEASRASAAPGKEMEKTTTASCEGWNTYEVS